MFFIGYDLHTFGTMVILIKTSWIPLQMDILVVDLRELISNGKSFRDNDSSHCKKESNRYTEDRVLVAFPTAWYTIFSVSLQW